MGNAPDAAVTAEGVRYSRGDRVVLEHVDLRVLPGEVTAVVGTAGSGRTTILQILGGVARPDAGNIRLAGHDPVADPAAARGLVGVVSEEVSVWEFLSCTEVLDALARGHRLPRAVRTDRIAEVLAMTGLGEAGDLYTEDLDLAGKRRFSLAAALLHDPPILLLDCPTYGLDPATRRALLQLVRDQADTGRAVVITGTDVSEFADIADTAILLVDGRTSTAQPMSEISEDGRRVRPWLVRSLDQPQLSQSLSRLGLTATGYGSDGALIRLAGDAEAADLTAALAGYGVPLVALQPLVPTQVTATQKPMVGPRPPAEELR